MIHTHATGQLTKKPRLITTKNNKLMAMSSIRCKATSFNDKTPLFINYSLIAFEAKAEKLGRYENGDVITVEGVLSLNKWSQEGKLFSNHKVLIERISDKIPVQQSLF